MNPAFNKIACAVAAAACVSSTASGQPVPQTWWGVPDQIIPQFQETGAPSFTTPLGSATNPAVVGGPGIGGGGLGGSPTTGSPTTGATAAVGNGSSVIYTDPDGTTTTLTGGSAAWRNNNPGNIVYNSNTQALGAIGQNNGFAVFPDVATGTSALSSILGSSTYQALSVDRAIARYAPSFQNDTAAYQRFVTSTLGVPGTTPLNSLSPSQMQSLQGAIQRQEGYTPGTVSQN